jgi:uncharacterized membrane protein
MEFLAYRSSSKVKTVCASFFWYPLCMHRAASFPSLPALLLVAAAFFGVIDSTYLVLEYLRVLAEPGTPTPCTVNGFVSCTLTVQGAFSRYIPGVPNPLWGMLWYTGCLTYGVGRLLGSTFSVPMRRVVGVMLALGLAFSYRLYVASVWQLGGVCPFCLMSTTASTVIALAFIIDDLRSETSAFGAWGRRGLQVFQGVTTLLYIVGLPLFLVGGFQRSIDPWRDLWHWSMLVIAATLVVSVAVQVWAYVCTPRHRSRR